MNNENQNQQNQFNSIESQMNNNQPQFAGVEPQLNNSQPQFVGVEPQLNNDQPQFVGVEPQLNNDQPQLAGVEPQLNNGQPQFAGVEPQLNNSQPQFAGIEPQLNNSQPQFDGVEPQLNNGQSQFNGVAPQNNNNKVNLMKNKKTLYIIGGAILLLLVAVILYFTVFKKEESYTDYEDYLKEQEKIKEQINKKYSIKDYKIKDGILVELKNNNNLMVDAELKIEFYDKNGSIIDIADTYMYEIPAKETGYKKVNIDEDIKYSTYKITTKLDKSPYEKSYHDKVTIVSANVQDDKYIIQVKNETNIKLDDVEIGVLFLGDNNSIIDYENINIYEINSGETISEKIYIPYGENFRDTIDYKKIEVKVLSAVTMED